MQAHVMTILFDLLGAQPNNVGSKYHGGGEYIKTVFKRLVELYSEEHKIIVFYNKDKFIDEWILKLIAEKNITEYLINEYGELNIIFDKENIDVYYSGMPYERLDFPMPHQVRKIGTIHGLRSLEKPTDYYEYKYKNGLQCFKSLLKLILQKHFKIKAYKHYQEIVSHYDDIVCDSNHTFYAMKSFYSHLKISFRVFYPPAKYIENNYDTIPKVSGKYILMLGLDRWEKNGYRAIMAIEDLLQKGFLKDYKIALVGNVSSQIASRMKHESQYVKYNYLETSELENLYKNCDFLVYPSLNEGFGLPPLEAMKYGKTCVVSAICSLTEVCGNAVYYFNPYDLDEMKNRILMASENKIDKDIIFLHVNKLTLKQQEDLDALCHFIVDEKHLLGA